MQRAATAELSRFLDSWLTYQASQVQPIGAALTIMLGSNVIHQGAYGQASLKTARPLTIHDLFCMGSQSKTITAAIVLRLMEQGKIDLHAPAAMYLPWLHEHPNPIAARITIQHLLHHTSGFVREGAEAPFWVLQAPFPTQHQLQKLTLASEVVYTPTTKLKYSNLGYALLGQIIEAVTDMQYAMAAQKMIIEPLALKETYPDLPRMPKLSISEGHTRYIRGVRALYAQAVPLNTFSPVTGWYSTPSDMALLFHELYHDTTLLSDRSRRLLTEGEWGHFTTETQHYTAGTMVFPDSEQKLIGHGGAYFGHQSCTLYDPAHDVTISLAANTHGVNASALAMAIHELYRAYAQLSNWTASDRFAGVFVNPGGVRYVGPYGEHLASYNLHHVRPLHTQELLSEQSKTTLRVTHASYVGCIGERVRYEFQENGRPHKILYGAVPAWSSDEYTPYQD